jgi:hypothetical protein
MFAVCLSALWLMRKVDAGHEEKRFESWMGTERDECFDAPNSAIA